LILLFKLRISFILTIIYLILQIYVWRHNKLLNIYSILYSFFIHFILKKMIKILHSHYIISYCFQIIFILLLNRKAITNIQHINNNNFNWSKNTDCLHKRNICDYFRFYNYKNCNYNYKSNKNIKYFFICYFFIVILLLFYYFLLHKILLVVFYISITFFLLKLRYYIVSNLEDIVHIIHFVNTFCKYIHIILYTLYCTYIDYY